MSHGIAFMLIVVLSACQTKSKPLTVFEKKMMAAHHENFCHESGEIFYEIQKGVDEGLSREHASNQWLSKINNDHLLDMHSAALIINEIHYSRRYLNEHSVVQYGIEFERCRIQSEYDVSIHDIEQAYESALNCSDVMSESITIYSMRNCLAGE